MTMKKRAKKGIDDNYEKQPTNGTANKLYIKVTEVDLNMLN